MKHANTLSILRNLFPRLNQREFTELDCWQIARKHKILVRLIPLRIHGYSGETIYRKRRVHYIVIDSRLRGVEFVATFLHEIAHCMIHKAMPTKSFHRERFSVDSKFEVEADIFMLLGLFPTEYFLKLCSDLDLAENYPRDLLEKRWKLYLKIGE